MTNLPIWAQTAGLLVLSNVFMTFAWYGHLKNLSSKPWWIAALVSWGIALFEYLLQVPANRIGASEFSLAQLKIMQEVITLAVFVPFAVYYMNQPMRWIFQAFCVCSARSTSSSWRVMSSMPRTRMSRARLTAALRLGQTATLSRSLCSRESPHSLRRRTSRRARWVRNSVRCGDKRSLFRH